MHKEQEGYINFPFKFQLLPMNNKQASIWGLYQVLLVLKFYDSLSKFEIKIILM